MVLTSEKQYEMTAKHTLSTAHQAKVEIKGLFGGKDLSETIKRDVFEKLNEKLFAKTLKAIKKLSENRPFSTDFLCSFDAQMINDANG